MADKPEEYSWSSYRTYALGRKDSLLTEDIFYAELGQSSEERQNRYKDMVIDLAIAEYMDKNDTIAVGNKNFVYNSNRRARYHETNRNTFYRKRGS